MTAKSTALSALCLFGVSCALWLPAHGRYTPSVSYALGQTKRCKVVVKTVHGHRKKVRKCRPAHPTATPLPPLFKGPSDLVTTANGNILVADQGHHRIVTLSPTGAVLAKWTAAGAAPATFQQLYGIALDGSGDVYVTDAANHAVDEVDSTGKPIAQWSTSVAEAGSFPTLLAVAPSGDIYVPDHTAEAVLRFSSAGALLEEIGKGEFGDPYGVALGPNGNLYVTDYVAGRVREFTPDGTQVSTWGDGANGTVALQQPEAIAVDGMGKVYVTEGVNHVIKFDVAGHVLADWGATSKRKLNDPSGIALDAQGNIYVTEYLGNQVDKLSPNGDVLATWR